MKRIPISLFMLAITYNGVCSAGDQDQKMRTVSATLEEGKKTQTRALGGTPASGTPAGEADKIAFKKSLFSGANNFFIGAGTVDGAAKDATKMYSVSRIQTTQTGGATKVAFVPLARTAAGGLADDVVVNAAAAAASPLANQTITYMSHGADYAPVVNIADNAGANQDVTHVYYVKPNAQAVVDGKLLLVNKQNDAGLTDDKRLQTSQPADAAKLYAITATQLPVAITNAGAATTDKANLVFAAVGDDTLDNAGHAGIGVVKVNDNWLEPVDSRGGGAGAQALAFNRTEFQGGTKFAESLGCGPMGITNSVQFDQNSTVATWWDQQLEKLYVGFTKASNANPTQGNVSVLVGGMAAAGANPKLTMRSVIGSDVNDGANKPDPTGASLKLVQGNDQYIVGSISGGGRLYTDILNLRTMHTSTGKDYVIVNGGVAAAAAEDALKSWVFALPVMPKGSADATAGMLAKINVADGSYELPTAEGDLVKVDRTHSVAGVNFTPEEAKAVVGVDPRFIAPHTDLTIKDIEVVGDTVYMCLGDQANPDNRKLGVFASTALFDTNGNIRAWTPAQRVMGQVGRVYGAGLDTTTGEFYALTSEAKDFSVVAPADDINTVRVSQWGKTDSVGIGNLTAVLEQIFPASEGGIVGMYSFDQYTPGFDVQNCFAMLVVLGVSKVALVQTAKKVNNAGNDHIVIEDTFVYHTPAQLGDNVFVFEDQAIKDIAPLTYAEMSRMLRNPVACGWLFVGGMNGIAVLRQANGDGFVPGLHGLQALAAGAYPDPANGWTFKKLEPNNPGQIHPATAFNNIRKMASDGTYLNIVTPEHLYYIRMRGDKFADVPTNDLNEWYITGFPDGIIFSDLVPFSTGTAIVATSDGIYTSNLNAAAVKQNNMPTDFVTQLQFLSNNRTGVNIGSGNSYAMAAGVPYRTDVTTDSVYRLDVPDAADANGVNADAVKPVVKPNTSGDLLDYSDVKQGADVDGTFVSSTQPKHFDNDVNLEIDKINSSMTGSADVTSLLDVNTDDYQWVAGVMREGASGVVMVPGEWGVRVNG